VQFKYATQYYIQKKQKPSLHNNFHSTVSLLVYLSFQTDQLSTTEIDLWHLSMNRSQQGRSEIDTGKASE